jgi:hypothetical protein
MRQDFKLVPEVPEFSGNAMKFVRIQLTLYSRDLLQKLVLYSRAVQLAAHGPHVAHKSILPVPQMHVHALILNKVTNTVGETL